MAANVGRNLQILKALVVIASVRNKSISFAGEPVDITNDDDLGFRTLLAEEGQKSIDMSVDGVTTDAVLRGLALSGSSLMLTDINIEWPNGDTLTGDFFLSSFEESGAYKDAVTFTASLQSSGPYVYTAA
jgi:predicted secreted protein